MTKDDDDDFYRPPLPTTAGLMFPARFTQTVRGFTLATLPAEDRWRQIISASQHERDTCLLTLADPNLWNLHDQPKPVNYVDVDGRQRTHRFDYLAVYRDGTKCGLAVEPEERAIKLNFRQTLTDNPILKYLAFWLRCLAVASYPKSAFRGCLEAPRTVPP